MKQVFKAKIQAKGRINILDIYLVADNIKQGDIVQVTIEKVDIKKED